VDLTVKGKKDFREHGVSIKNGEKAGEYVAKWGMQEEIAKSHIKHGHEGHLTPFDFLRKYVKGDRRYGTLFRRYATVFKGKRQLVWSRGLRDAFGMSKELTDAELAARLDENASKFALIPLIVWRMVLTHKKRGEVLEVCQQGREALYDYLSALMRSTLISTNKGDEP
jgi:hypothetical protein